MPVLHASSHTYPAISHASMERHAGKNLQAQYERWQPRAKYRMHLDPTMDDVKKLAVSSRRAAKVRAHTALKVLLPCCLPTPTCALLKLDAESTNSYPVPASLYMHAFLATIRSQGHSFLCIIDCLVSVQYFVSHQSYSITSSTGIAACAYGCYCCRMSGCCFTTTVMVFPDQL